MSDKSKIEWCDATWQLVAGCTPAGAGCANCYSARLCATRLQHLDWAKGLASMVDGVPEWSGEVRERWDRLDDVLRWKRPRRIFVADRGDLFHSKVSLNFRVNVRSRIRDASQHTYLALTKRPRRMALEWASLVWDHPIVWCGVSCSTQEDVNKLVPLTRGLPRRWISLEPLLEPVKLDLDGISWVVVGGESGPLAGPCELEWLADVLVQCRVACVPIFIKQIGTVKARELGLGGKGDYPPAWPEELRVQQLGIK